jgi:hypothetical protein
MNPRRPVTVPLSVARCRQLTMRTELIPAADVQIGDYVLDEQGAPAVVTSTRWQGVGGGVVSIALSNHSDRRVFSGSDLVARAVLFG